MKPFKVAATQLAVRHRDTAGNLDLHTRFIAEAAKPGCQLIVFPELSITGHNGTPEVTRDAEPLDGRIFDAMHEAASENPVYALRKRRPETYGALTEPL